MATAIIILALTLAALAAGWIVSTIRSNSHIARQTDEIASLQAENIRLRERLSLSRTGDEMASDMADRFKALAAEVLRQNSEQLGRQHELHLRSIIEPLSSRIGEFKQAIAESFAAEARQWTQLDTRISELRDLHSSIGREARELTLALKGQNKVQGDWGEMILESILEKSGLQRNVHYTIQQTRDANGNALRNDEGNMIRPDVVINYPDGRSVVIDSKVSLTAFLRLAGASTDAEAELARRDHIESVRRQIKILSEKRYQDFVGDRKAEFAMMFIPNEPAYIAAMQADHTLWEYAFERKVIILSPTHLLTVLSLLSQLWKQDSLTRHIIDIATESGKMYDKFVAFVEDMQRFGQAQQRASEAWDKAMNKLSTGNGSLVTRARKLKEMGAKASKNLPANLGQTDETDN